MTMVALGGVSRFPDTLDMNMSAAQGTQTFDASTDLIAAVFQIPHTGTISNVHYRINSVSSPLLTLRVELRTVSATTGLPDAAGTLYGSSTSITLVNPVAGAKTAAVNCTGATAGDLVALVLDISAYTSGSFALASRVCGAVSGSIRLFPYTVSNTTGTTATTFDTFNNFGLEYDSNTFYAMQTNCIVGTKQTTNLSTGSGQTRAGNRIRSAVRLRAVGIVACIEADADCLFRLRLASDDSILATCTLDKDVRGSNSFGIHEYFFDGGATVTLEPSVDYYVLVETSSATTMVAHSIGLIPQQAMLDQLSGGQNCYGTLYLSGSYIDDTTTRIGVELMYDALDDGSSVASGIYMFGGI